MGKKNLTNFSFGILFGQSRTFPIWIQNRFLNFYGERYHVLKHSNESLASILWMKLHQHKLALNSYFYLFIYLHIYLFIYLFEKKIFSEFDSVITRIKSGSCKFRDLLPLLASRVFHQEQKTDYVLHV